MVTKARGLLPRRHCEGTFVIRIKYTVWREYATDNRFICCKWKGHINSSFVLGQQIFTFSFNFFLFWTQWIWAGPKLSEAFYGVHQTSDSSSIKYDDSGFHSGDLSKTGVFTHRWVNVIRLAFSYRNETVFCIDVMNLAVVLVIVKILLKLFHTIFIITIGWILFFTNSFFFCEKVKKRRYLTTIVPYSRVTFVA